MEASWFIHQAQGGGASPPFPLLYNDGEHTYVCVQTPQGPEYIQRRMPAADAPRACSVGSGSEIDTLWRGYACANSADPPCTTTTTTSTSFGGDSSSLSFFREEFTETTDTFTAGEISISGDGGGVKEDIRGCKRRFPGVNTSSSFPNCVSHTSDKDDTYNRTFKHSRSFGYTHVMSSSSA